ncbi:hypothetical protein GW796_06650 [archaeon]|nr:hypothetical protein [archaeon]
MKKNKGFKMLNYHPEVFRLYNDIYSENVNIKYINDLLFWNKTIPKEIEMVLNKIQIQCLDIYKSLESLERFGLTFDIFLVGGSVRDLILGKSSSIKDLDIMISLSQPLRPKLPSAIDFIDKSGFNFELTQLKKLIYKSKKNIKFEHWNKNKSLDKNRNLVFFDMISCALGQKFDLYHIYEQSLKQKDSNRYLDLRIEGVIKARSPNWTWDVDFLITNYNIDAFLSAFDFGICKVGLELIRGQDIREHKKNFPETAKDLLKNVRLTNSFIEDATNKQLSMIIGYQRTVKELHHSCEIHLKQLVEKYPWDVKIMFDENAVEKYMEIEHNPIDEYIKSFLLKHKLSQTLPKNKGVNNLKKI